MAIRQRQLRRGYALFGAVNETKYARSQSSKRMERRWAQLRVNAHNYVVTTKAFDHRQFRQCAVGFNDRLMPYLDYRIRKN